jgi:IclR family acetate operon transcriptional repressor
MTGVDRVASVLDALQERRVASLAEVARAAGLSEPTAHRYLSALSEHRLVTRDPYTGAYRLGLKLFELGRNALPLPDPREAARPHLRALRDQFGETAEMAAHDGSRLIIIAVEEALHGVAKGAHVGEPDRWHSTSLGKSILAELDPATARSILEAATLTRFTSRTLVDPDEVLASLARVRANGYAMDDEESEVGLRCIGAVVRNGRGEPRYAISVSGPTYRITLESVDRIAAAVRQAAEAISRELAKTQG